MKEGLGNPSKLLDGVGLGRSRLVFPRGLTKTLGPCEGDSRGTRNSSALETWQSIELRCPWEFTLVWPGSSSYHAVVGNLRSRKRVEGVEAIARLF